MLLKMCFPTGTIPLTEVQDLRHFTFTLMELLGCSIQLRFQKADTTGKGVE